MVIKSTKYLSFVTALLFATQAWALNDGDDKIKKYVNGVVQEVVEADNAEDKRAILNKSLNKLIDVFDRVENMKNFSPDEVAGVVALKSDLIDRRDQLNGINGFARIPDNQLNNYASFVQQNMEQADTYITLSAGLAIVIVLLLLLL